jgi:hypothetical protein
MFASRSTDIGSQLPLWAVQDDGIPGVNTVDTFMGGWTSAVAKQYNLGEFSIVILAKGNTNPSQEQLCVGRVLI